MAVDPNDMNEIRVDVLGTSVDKATTWTSGGPAAGRNALITTERIITRAINAGWPVWWGSYSWAPGGW